MLAERDGVPGLVAEQVVVDRLGVAPGAMLRLGSATLQLRGVLLAEPDRVAAPTLLGPRVMIASWPPWPGPRWCSRAAC